VFVVLGGWIGFGCFAIKITGHRVKLSVPVSLVIVREIRWFETQGYSTFFSVEG
jgi:hypothetical protein